MTLKKLLFVTAILFLTNLNSFACLNTYQFKIFPIGIYENQIVSVDVMVNRTSVFEAIRHYGLKTKGDSLGGEFDVAWRLKTHITFHSFEQEPIQIIAFDSTVVATEDYSKELQKLYKTAFEKIKKDYPAIELFDIEYLSFCDYQQNCKQVVVEYDTTQKANFFIYNNQKYPTQLFQKPYYYGTGYALEERTIKGYYINSIRIYKARNKKIVISHLHTGHEIIMGGIKTGDYENEMGGTQKIPSETETDVSKYELANCIYQEPTLHHGFGFDAFFVVEE